MKYYCKCSFLMVNLRRVIHAIDSSLLHPLIVIIYLTDNIKSHTWRNDYQQGPVHQMRRPSNEIRVAARRMTYVRKV